MNSSAIRLPLPTEIDSLVRIWLEGNLQAHSFISSDYWLSHVDYMRDVLPMSEVYVCEIGGVVAGFIGLEGDYIAGLFVDKRYRSQGVGSKLIDYVKQKHGTLTLAVYEKNAEAMKFYCNRGFAETEKCVDANTNEKEILMKWH